MRIVVYILIFSLVMPITLKFGLMMNYQVQYDYYVNVLCENKDNDSLECNGKCALMKELKSVDSHSPEEPTVPAATHFEVFIEDINSQNIEKLTFYNPKVNDYYCNHYTLSWFNKIDQPPKYL